MATRSHVLAVEGSLGPFQWVCSGRAVGPWPGPRGRWPGRVGSPGLSRRDTQSTPARGSGPRSRAASPSARRRQLRPRKAGVLSTDCRGRGGAGSGTCGVREPTDRRWWDRDWARARLVAKLWIFLLCTCHHPWNDQQWLQKRGWGPGEVSRAPGQRWCGGLRQGGHLAAPCTWESRAPGEGGAGADGQVVGCQVAAPAQVGSLVSVPWGGTDVGAASAVTVGRAVLGLRVSSGSGPRAGRKGSGMERLQLVPASSRASGSMPRPGLVSA